MKKRNLSNKLWIIVIFFISSSTINANGPCNFSIHYSKNILVNCINCYDFWLENLPENYSVTWDFGDGNTSVKLKPSHSFIVEREYNICVTIYSNDINYCAQCIKIKVPEDEKSCDYEGYVVDYSGLDGCGLMVKSNDELLNPVIMNDSVGIYSGMNIQFSFNELTDLSSTCMAGKNIEITCLDEITSINFNDHIQYIELVPKCPTIKDEIKLIVSSRFTSGSCSILNTFINKVDTILYVHSFHELGEAAYICSTLDTINIGKLNPGFHNILYRITIGIQSSAIHDEELLAIYVNNDTSYDYAGEDQHICLGDTSFIGRSFFYPSMGIPPEFMWKPETGLEDSKDPYTRAFPFETTTYYLYMGYPYESTFPKLIDSVTVYVDRADFEYVLMPVDCFEPPCLVEASEFIDQSEGDIYSWSWDFGDGATSNEQNPNPHVYQTNKNYIACLTIKTQNNCLNTVCKKIEFVGSEDCHNTIKFTVNNLEELTNCNIGAKIELLDQFGNIKNPFETLWSKGDSGQHAFGLCPQQQYEVTVIDSNNCVNIARLGLWQSFINDSIISGFWSYESNGSAFNFNFSELENYLIKWNIEGDSVYFGSHVEYTFSKSGIYDVIVSVTDENNNIIFSDTINAFSILSIQNKSHKKPEICVYPNPVKDYFVVGIPENITGKITIILNDLTGTKLVDEKFEIFDNQNILINAVHLKNGYYIGSVFNNNMVVGNFKLIKL